MCWISRGKDLLDLFLVSLEATNSVDNLTQENSLQNVAEIKGTRIDKGMVELDDILKKIQRELIR